MYLQSIINYKESLTHLTIYINPLPHWPSHCRIHLQLHNAQHLHLVASAVRTFSTMMPAKIPCNAVRYVWTDGANAVSSIDETLLPWFAWWTRGATCSRSLTKVLVMMNSVGVAYSVVMLSCVWQGGYGQFSCFWAGFGSLRHDHSSQTVCSCCHWARNG